MRKLLKNKKAYISIEAIIVIGLVLALGILALGMFSVEVDRFITEENNETLSVIDVIIREMLESPSGETPFDI